jgi:hypothetical protein
MSPLPPPPVPHGLRELLKDYPEHIQTLQEDLNKVVAKRSPGIDPFDRAIWMLESALAAFISEAREELKIAETIGDAEVITRAKEKERLMGRARSGGGGMLNISDLSDYFQTYKDALK